MFFNEYPEKVWGISVDQMTSDWAPKKNKIYKKNLSFFLNEFTAVGKYGTGSIYEKIRDEIINLGGVIKLGYEIKNLDFDNSEIRKVYFKNKKPRVINKEDIIISSLPLPLTAKFLGHKSNLKFRGIRSIYISVNKKKYYQQKLIGSILDQKK